MKREPMTVGDLTGGEIVTCVEGAVRATRYVVAGERWCRPLDAVTLLEVGEPMFVDCNEPMVVVRGNDFYANQPKGVEVDPLLERGRR